MSLLKNLTTDESIANERDSVGGFGPLESGLYKAKIDLAYIQKSDGGAMALVIHLKTEDGKDIRSTQWMTSGTAKGCLNYYTDKKGDKQYLPGFLHANSLALLTVGKEIADLDTEVKVINKYNADAKAEIPTKVDMVTDLIGKEITVGLVKQIVDKTQKGDDGKYYPTGETREENEIDKLFRASDNKTTAEIRAQVEDASFFQTWADKWTGKVKDKSTKGAAGNAGTAGAPKGAKVPGSSSSKPTASLFAGT